VVGLGIVTPIVLLSALFVWSDIFVMRSVAAPPPGSTPITIDVIGHDWWWEARYAGTAVVTVNEIHIPTRTRVQVTGRTTADVIHSFWVPELAPQDRPMAVVGIAQRPAAFRRRLVRQKQPATATNSTIIAESCASCHTIRGTPARGEVGPDLTHFASRQTLAAITLPNTPAYVRAWIRDPGRFKPGTRMPKLPLTAKQVEELAAYLERLK
jgi:cytochrome c oxidase subunit 2